MVEMISKNDSRHMLQRLIDYSGVHLSVDDILREFYMQNDKTSKRRLLRVLELLSKDIPKADEHLAEVSRLLDSSHRDPIFALLKFVQLCNEAMPQTEPAPQSQTQTSQSTQSTVQVVQAMEVVQAVQPTQIRKDITHSTPLVPKKTPDKNITPENVSEIKERVLQAALCRNVASKTASSRQSFSARSSNALSPRVTQCIRTHALWDFHNFENMFFQQCNISAMPVQSQESLLLFDLIHCLSGMQGTYVRTEQSNTAHFIGAIDHPQPLQFRVDQVDRSLRDLAFQLLPLASHYSIVQKFIGIAAQEHCGKVLQALSEAISTLVNDYFLLLSELETELNKGSLTLQRMLYLLGPTISIMEVLASLITVLSERDARGGQALTLIFDKISTLSGDTGAQEFVVRIMQKAVEPYMKILQLWIQKGIIIDPHQEFLVEDNELVRREELPQHYSADYWEKRYTIRRERSPCFLDKHSDMILRTGKYLNVIRQCGKKVTPSQNIDLEFSLSNQHYIDGIQSAYQYASKNLLEVLLKENDLMGHLISVKRYLLLHQGDFITQFMDACEDELSKNVDKVLPMTLENLLGLTLRVSSAKQDAYKDDVHCELLTYDLVTQMSKIMCNEEEYWQSHDRHDLTGLECFAFRYDVKWPISLVLNHIAISKYQMLFRQLFYCKHVERQLCKIWKENAIAKKFSPQAAEQYRSAFTLRQRMMNAVQNLEYYMMIEVIEPNWHLFIQNMNKVENVDEVLSFHQDFLDSCLKNCMLTDSIVLNRSIFKLCNICLKFCEFIQTETSLSPTDTFSERVKRFDLEFTGVLISLLKQINDVAIDNPSDGFINLVHRINFNSFYNEQMEKLCAKDSMN